MVRGEFLGILDSQKFYFARELTVGFTLFYTIFKGILYINQINTVNTSSPTAVEIERHCTDLVYINPNPYDARQTLIRRAGPIFRPTTLPSSSEDIVRARNSLLEGLGV